MANFSFTASLGESLNINVAEKILTINLHDFEDWNIRLYNPVTGTSIVIPESDLTLVTIGMYKLNILPEE